MKNKDINKQENNDITRKEALKKIGTYTAFTALGTMVLLSPKEAQAGSSAPEPPKRQKPANPKRQNPVNPSRRKW